MNRNGDHRSSIWSAGRDGPWGVKIVVAVWVMSFWPVVGCRTSESTSSDLESTRTSSTPVGGSPRESVDIEPTRRRLPRPAWIQGVDPGPLVVPMATFEEFAGSLRMGYPMPPPREARPVRDPSSEEVRAYVRGRALLAAGRPNDSLRWLREASGSNAPEVRVAIADALSRLGRITEMVSVLWSLALDDTLPPAWEPALIEGLIQRRRYDDAMAVLIRSVDRTEEDVFRFAGWISITELLVDLNRGQFAAGIRRSLVERWEPSWAGLDIVLPKRLAAFLREAGDDAMRSGDSELAHRTWMAARRFLPEDPSIRRRLLWSSASLGLDADVQALLLEASRFPSDADLQGAAWARENGVELEPLKRRLRVNLLEDSGVLGTAQMLVAVDPLGARDDLRRLAIERPELDLAEAIVLASMSGGPVSAVETAGALVGDLETLDAVVDVLIGGPWGSEDLLAAAVQSTDASATPLVAAEILRRYHRPDLAGRRLNRSFLREEWQDLIRIVQLRRFADAGDAVLAAGVPKEPFDLSVERERVKALVACGELELAQSLATELIEKHGEESGLRIERSRIFARLLDSELPAFEDALAAYERDASTESALLLMDLAFEYGIDIEGAEARIRRTLEQIEFDERFRRLLAADRAWKRGDWMQVITELEPLLGTISLRKRILSRLIPAYAALGRLEDVHRRLLRLQKQRPADIDVREAIFTIDRRRRDVRELAIELRPEVESSIDGLPAVWLIDLLQDIPESQVELIRRRRALLDRMPDGPARAIERVRLDLEDGIDVPSTEFEFELETWPDRLRRRYATMVEMLPREESVPILDRILGLHRLRDSAIDVDTTIAALRVLPAGRSWELLSDMIPAPARSRLDSSWASRIGDLIDSDPAVAASLGRFAISGLTPAEAEPNLLRVAIAAGIQGGVPADELITMLDGSLALGWSPRESWATEDADPLALRGVASDATMLGDRRIACDLLGRLVESRPGDAVALNNLGYGLLTLGDLDGAAEALERSYELDPANPSTLDSLGWLRYAQGRHDKDDPDGALSLILRSVDRRVRSGITPSPEVMIHVGDASWRAGLRDDAIAAWRSVVELGARRDPGQRARVLQRYQDSIWGTVLVPAETLDFRLDGIWIEGAEARLRAWTEGRPPPVTDFSDAVPPVRTDPGGEIRR